MTLVFNNAMVAHVWASQSQAEGRSNNGQYFFEGPTLFSYGRHYAAGFVLPGADVTGGPVYMVNSDSYSVTTSRHTMLAAQAIPGRPLYVPGLTDWAATLWAGIARYGWNEAAAQEEEGNRPAWLPCGYVLKSAKERRAFLPELRARFARHDFPGEEAAVFMFRALGDSNPERAAAAQARKAEAKAAKEAARRDRQERDALARAAKHNAQKSPRAMAREISEVLGGYSQSDYARDMLAAKGRKIHAEAKEAKARGWSNIAATLRAHYKAIRAAVKDAEKRNAAAYRNRNRRRSIDRFRAAADCVQTHVAAVAAGKPWQETGSAGGLARVYDELSRAAADLSRHLPLAESTLARLSSIQEAARIKAADWQEEARRIAYAEEEEARADWLAGRPGRYGRRLSDSRGGALLRARDVERDDSGAIVGGELETSHGAAVPLTHALRVFRFLKACRAKGEGWQRNGRALRVGHFQVDTIAPNGDFKAGCHAINWQEVERLAGALGVAELTPEDTTESSKAPA